MPDEKAPSSGAFLPASLMYFCSGEPMHFLSGVDTFPYGYVLRQPNDARGAPLTGC
jgi:hypothetical protein